MSSFPNLFAILYSLINLIILTTQWTGILLLAKPGMNGGWWTMLLGAVLTTLATIGTMIVQYIISNNGSTSMIQWYQATGMAHTVGAFLFFLGFVIHALIVRGKSARVAELEGIIASQAQENARLREAGR